MGRTIGRLRSDGGFGRGCGVARAPGPIWPAPDACRRPCWSDAVREGFHGSAWFAHRLDGVVSHVEVRGPSFKGSLRGGAKTLFRFGWVGEGTTRLAIAEAPIDALSLAAIEGVRADTLYLATGGGMGPGTVAAIEAELHSVAATPQALLASATDVDRAGERYAAQHADLAARTGVRFERLAPTVGADWNDTLVRPEVMKTCTK